MAGLWSAHRQTIEAGSECSGGVPSMHGRDRLGLIPPHFLITRFHPNSPEFARSPNFGPGALRAAHAACGPFFQGSYFCRCLVPASR